MLLDEGFGSEHLGVAVREGTGIDFERDDDADYARDLTRGAAHGGRRVAG